MVARTSRKRRSARSNRAGVVRPRADGMIASDTGVVECLQNVRSRTRSAISNALLDNDALRIALASSLAESTALLEFSLEKTVRTDALRSKTTLALSSHEFCALFATPDPTELKPRQRADATNGAMLRTFEALPEWKELRAQLEAALSTTLTEPAQRTAWTASPSIRVAASIALLRDEDAIDCVDAVIGGLVRTDVRKLEELKTTIEDAGIDVMCVSDAVAALSSSIV